MTSLPHSAPARLTHTIATLFGHDDDTLLAWQRFCVQATDALRAAHDSTRLTTALALAQEGAVELEDDGLAVVTSGTTRYHVHADGTCDCPDAAHRGALCKHALAVLIHARAQALLAPSNAPESAAPQPAALPAPRRPATARPSAAWDVHEAPASACLKFRVGTMELLYTLRGIDDAELQRRMAATLPSLHALLAACEERTAQRTAAKAAAPHAAGHPAPAAPPDLQALVAQAVAAALAGSANGHSSANGQAAGAPASMPAADDQASGFCTLHQEAMELHENERGAWYSHYLEDEDRYCKGAKPPRRNGRR
jgi:hypothetical protein